MLKDVIAHTNNTPRPYFESPLFWKCQICVFWRFLRFFRNFHKFEARVHVFKVLVEIFGGFVTSNDALNVSRPIFIVLKISDLQNFLKFLYIEF